MNEQIGIPIYTELMAVDVAMLPPRRHLRCQLRYQPTLVDAAVDVIDQSVHLDVPLC